MDAAHFVWGTGFLMSVWCFVQTSSGRKRYNVLGAYNAITRKFLSVVNDSYINSSSVCEMLRLLRRSHVREAITVILDNAAYRRCLLVQGLAAELDVSLEFLPSYSPNLNLIERLWKFTKKQCLNTGLLSESSIASKKNSKHKSLTKGVKVFALDSTYVKVHPDGMGMPKKKVRNPSVKVETA